MRLKEITHFLEQRYPLAWQESYDNSGLTCGNPEQQVQNVFISLDPTAAHWHEVQQQNCQLWITHHPLLFYPLKKMDWNNPNHALLQKLLTNNVAHYALHTNFDVAPQGTNEGIAKILGLEHCRKLINHRSDYAKIVVFVPTDHCQKVINSLSAAGAGQIGQYESCAFHSQGVGCFTPLAQANPFIGKPLTLTRVDEARLEMIFPLFKQRAIESALRASHPYEQPAYDIITLHNRNPEIGLGLIGELPQAVLATEFLTIVRNKLAHSGAWYVPNDNKTVQKIAIAGGSGGDFVYDAIAAQCDVLITAECKHHHTLDAVNKILLVQLTHYDSEACVPNEICAGFKAMPQQEKLNFFLPTSANNPLQPMF